MNALERWYHSLLKSIQLQLFITCISLPFLIAWGLPISLLTPVSTLIFGPFLTCFLLISSLIFFCELLYVPNALLIWCLEKVTFIWLACLNLEQRAWLIAFGRPSLIILFCIPVGALVIIHSKKVTCIIRRILLLALFLITMCLGLKFLSHSTTIVEKIPCNKGEITLINYNNTFIVVDPGVIAARPSYESFISYSLVPEIIQKTGRLEIDHLVVCRFNKRMLDALQFLATKMIIKKIYIPAWKGRIPLFAWRSYVNLKKTVAEYDGKIVSLSYKKELYSDKHSKLFIEPADTKDIPYYDATYRALCIKGTVNNCACNV
jgi:hypothetical protein